MSRNGMRDLQRELSVLRQEIRALRLQRSPTSMEEVLRRRGISMARCNPADDLLFPSRLSPSMGERLYELLRKYSFRLFLRDVIASRNHLTEKELTRFCSQKRAGEYLKVLVQARIVLASGHRSYRLAKNLQSFGPTLEWLVAQVFEREFCSPALWGVRLLDMAPGGDYDVLSLVEGDLVYVEVKSSPPKHIEQREIAAFLDRVGELIPNVALFFVDTELRMKDKIVQLFEAEFRRRERKAHVKRLVDELFLCDDRIFLVNSRPALVSSLGRCLRHWLGSR